MDSIPLYKFLPDESDTPIKVIELNERKGYDSQTPHRHGYYEIFFFERDGGIHSIDFNNIPIAKYSIHAVSPGQVHTLIESKNQKGFFILFGKDIFNGNSVAINNLLEYPFLNNNSKSKTLQLDNNEFKEILSLVNSLNQNIEMPSIAIKWLELILAYTKEHFVKQYANTDAFVKNEVYRKFKILLEKNYHEQHLPSWYASQLSLSQNRLNEIIKTQTGETIGKNIKDRILLEAKRLIQHSSVSFKEIAYELGFSDPTYFSRFVKKNTNKTPKKLRNDSMH